MYCLLPRFFIIFFFFYSSVLVAAPVGVNWQWENPRPQANSLRSVSADTVSGKIVTVGALGTIVSSDDDGANWSVQASGTRNRLNSVKIMPAAGITYVVGDYGVILSSPNSDFSVWTSHTGAAGQLNDIAWNQDPLASIFVIAGKSGIYTNDGSSTNWTSQTLPPGTSKFNGVAWHPTLNIFVAVSLDKYVITSPDGVTWTRQPYNATYGFHAIIWDESNNQLVASGASGLLATSPDGVNWVERATAVSNTLSGITESGGNLYAAGGSSVSIIKSTDAGVSWNSVNTSVTSSVSYADVTTGKTGILTVATGGLMERGTNAAANWSQVLPVSSVTSVALTDVAYNGSRFVAVSNASGSSFSSVDGRNWTGNSSPSTPQYIHWDGSGFVGVFAKGIFSSADGLSWSRSTVSPTNGPAGNSSDILWDGTQYVAVGDSGYIMTSPDAAAANWTIQTSGQTSSNGNNLNAIVNGEDGSASSLLVAVGNNTTIIKSSDGVSWSSATTIPDIGGSNGRPLYDIAWSGTRYVVVAQLGKLLTSTDGDIWVDQSANISTSANLESVFWDGLQFVVGSAAGEIFTSADGLTWTKRDTPTATGVNAFSSNGTRMVAVGRTGMIISSEASFSIGGSVTGLSGTVVLQNNGGDNLQITMDGNFTFATALATGESYDVTVFAQPAGQNCVVSNASGSVSTADVTNVSVSCSNIATYTIGGTVSGLNGSLVLQNNGSDNETVLNNGSFTFLTPLNDTDNYAVSVSTQPSGQNCVVSNASGSVSTADVTNVSVTCSDILYNIGGTVSGLNGSLTLQNNAGNDLIINANGSFTFSEQQANNTTYAITVSAQPTDQNCAVTFDSGSVSTADVSNISVSCTDETPNDPPAGSGGNTAADPSSSGGGSISLYGLMVMVWLLFLRNDRSRLLTAKSR